MSSSASSSIGSVDRAVATRIVYSTDNSVYQVVPEAVALPTEVADIAQLLRDNAAAADPQPIVARGGGTGTNGQSLTEGVVVDLKRNLGRVLDLDVTGRTVTVEPGIVTAALNHELKPHGLHWAPHTSTLNRATVGGMISTDAAGKGSMVHGRAHRHVERLEVLLADGTPWTAEPVTIAEAERRASGQGSGAALWRGLLDLPIDDASMFNLPELARGFSGYGIDRLRRDGLVDPTALLCGAEGTLAIITSATLRLTQLPTAPMLIVASYESFDDALRDSVRLRDTGPQAIEVFDEVTLDRGRASPAWPALGAIVGDSNGAVLLLEYDSPESIDALIELVSSGPSVAAQATADTATQAAIWKVRADAVGLLAKVAVGAPQRSARPTAFVEDCAVPVAEMPAFIAAFRALLDDAGVTYGMFGHADVGCVHVRPALDLTDPADRTRHVELTDPVTDLVHAHGGILWGEHGRGFRGARIDEVLDAQTMSVMRQVKTAFDPLDLLNPGKLYRPSGVSTPLVGVADPVLRGTRDAVVAVELRRDHGDAFACNGNGLCHHWSADEVMCPSYVATGDPALSPKGRADLVREWLANRRGDLEFEQALVENLNQCLSCGACTGHCPVAVDIPELKSKVLSEIGPRPLSHRVLGRFEEAAWLASAMPRLANLGFPAVERITGLVDLPRLSTRRGRARRFDPSAPTDIVVLPDVFTAAIEPNTLGRSLEVIEGLGLSVSVERFVPSGKFDHVKGHRDRFRRAAERHREVVTRVVACGARPIVIEPAIALLHRHEYRSVVEDYPDDAVIGLGELLLEHVDRIERVVPQGRVESVRLLGHCTERANAPARLDAWSGVLTSIGFVVDQPDVGCCGMAGIFGHEVDNQTMSRTLWDASWSSKSTQGVVAATGYSCRSQAARFGSTTTHPIWLLAT